MTISLQHFTSRVSMIALALFSAALMSACNDKELPDLEGRYWGSQTALNATKQVIAQLPAFVPVGEKKVLRFKVYETLGSAEGTEYKIAVLNEKTLLLNSSTLSQDGVQLVKNGNCAATKTKERYAYVCWNKGKLDLEIQSAGESLKLTIQRDNSLPPLPATSKAGRIYSLDELMGRARFMNYAVSQEAERVFQARESIRVARGNLLPKVSLKSVVGVFTGDYLSVIGNAVPFLFPSNWYRWSASKALFEAERNSFASLRGNEMNFVEGLYYVILRDQMVLDQLTKQIEWMKSIQGGLLKEEEVGTLPTGTADFFGTSIALIERDQIMLGRLVKDQYSELAQAVALSPSKGISGLASITVPDLLKIKPISPDEYVRAAQMRSFEIKTLQALLKASSSMEKEMLFSFLDPEGSGAIGFGTVSSVRVSKSQQNELRKRIDETYSSLELKCATVASEYNAALDAYKVAAESLEATERRITWLIARHLNGDDLLDEDEFVDQLVDLQFKAVGFASDKASGTQAWLIAQSKLQRLLLAGFYKELEAALPQDKEKLKQYESQKEANRPTLL